MTIGLPQTTTEGQWCTSCALSRSGAHLPPPPNGTLGLLGRLNYSPRGRGEGWAGSLANESPGSPEEAGLLETTWLVPLGLTVLVLSSDTAKGSGDRSRGTGTVSVCARRRE